MLYFSFFCVCVYNVIPEVPAKCVEKIRGDLSFPIGVCTNSQGKVIVADTRNNIIKIFHNGKVIHSFGRKVCL